MGASIRLSWQHPVYRRWGRRLPGMTDSMTAMFGTIRDAAAAHDDK
jgi:hypothetical protein